ncbi:hypothetical protein AB870_08820 [Pandoraea faecigallinarum]|uniref:Serine protease n=1 Tax=Pandoraea faecigallinarum TaxID=656179 RepID=A0A0H3WPW4_9BURK|nr:trypsin-like peptidase domain-containing protein [Pandoraea faecigallinarum]AKM30189.1 hypothetical protein AB870_08820 [Pandoraea faecigallinarum]
MKRLALRIAAAVLTSGSAANAFAQWQAPPAPERPAPTVIPTISVKPVVTEVPTVPPAVATQVVQEARSSDVREALKQQDLSLKKEQAALLRAPQTPLIAAKVDGIAKARMNIASANNLLIGGAPDAEEVLTDQLETILAIMRPVYGFCSGAPWVDEQTVGWATWRDAVRPISSRIAAVARSVGVIFMYDDAQSTIARVGATVFVVGKSHVVTNRHVLKDYAYRDSSGKWVMNDDKQILSVSFPYEYRKCDARTTPRDVRIIGIESVGDADDDTADFAILRTEDNALPPPPPLADVYDLDDGARVAVIGYPARPVNCEAKLRPGEECANLTDPQIDALFALPNHSTTFPAERFAPGFTIPSPKLDDMLFTYDSSTWKGNSGSPVIRLSDGKIVGLHSGGKSRNKGKQMEGIYNNGIKIERVRKALADAGITQ